MTHIQQLITAADSLIPFQSASTAKAFLNQYSIDDQAALISALYIGRDHLHANQIQSNYIPATIPFDRFFILAEGMVFVGSSNLQNSQLFFMRRTQIYALIMRHLSVALMAQESISAPSSNRMRVVSIS